MNSNNTQYSYLEYSKQDDIQSKLQKLTTENEELKKINKNLNLRLTLLLKEKEVTQNVKREIQEYSDDSNDSYNEDIYKEFFYLLLLSEKMKHMKDEIVWMIDSAMAFKEVRDEDLPFYKWREFLEKKINALVKTKQEREKGFCKELIKTWCKTSSSFVKKLNTLTIDDRFLNENLTKDESIKSTTSSVYIDRRIFKDDIEKLLVLENSYDQGITR